MYKNHINEKWLSYSKQRFNNEIQDEVLEMMKEVFFCGAASMFHTMYDIQNFNEKDLEGLALEVDTYLNARKKIKDY